MSNVVFLTFVRLSCTVQYNRTVVSQPGAWEVNAGFPTETSVRALVMAVACFLSELCMRDSVCAERVGHCCGADL